MTKITDEMIERAAEAIWRSREGGNASWEDAKWDRAEETGWALDDARAALTAVLSPAPQAMAGEAEMEAGQTAAARDVLAERRRQVEVEGFTAKHDYQHGPGALARAGAWYAMNASTHARIGRGSLADMLFLDRRSPFCWPWEQGWWKPGKPRRDLVKAGALILAALDQMDRAAPTHPASQEGQADG